MKVWIVLYDSPYDSAEILKVFANEADATELRDAQPKSWRNNVYIEEHVVEGYELNSPMSGTTG